MKKLLSILLVVLMIVSSVPFVYAEESNTYKVGDIIQFGSYPQSKVTDSATITALNNKAPEWEGWTSYGYYSGNGSYGTMKQGDWMRYVDIKHDGNKYRGVKFTQYRPYYTYKPSALSYSYQHDNGYSTNTVYWFKFEPIDWRVLDPATGLVMCETIIDSQPYSNTIYSNGGGTYGYFNDSSYTNYASDYETSSIRQWLNTDFYNTAFTDSEKKEINTTTLNNDGYYTSVGTTGYEKLDSNSTNDKIFLLSYNEVRNSNYGFNSSASVDKARQAQGSNYAKSQGLYVSTSSSYYGNCSWLLRSPGSFSGNCCYVSGSGYSRDDYGVKETDNGVRPALRFNRISDIGQSEHQHDYSSVVTSPTCTARGYTTYTCECGDSYVNDYTDKLDHEYTSEITTEPTHLKEGETTYTCACGDTYTEAIAKLEGHTYTSKVTKEATHLEEGETTYTCACGDTYTEAIAKLTGHTYEEAVTAPTCTAKGYTTYTCECGDTYVADYTDKLDHEYTSEITTPATHLTEGVKTFTCKCGDTYTEPVAKLEGHTYTSELTKEATHLEEGETTYTCECGDSYTEAIAKLTAHTYNSVVTEPTCTDRGYTTYTCECGDSYIDDYTDKLDHVYASEITTPATHLTEGVETFTCECGDTYTKPVAKLEGHTYNSEVTKEPTHLEEGEMTFTCECGDSYTEVIEKIAKHNYKEDVTEPTCTAKGYTTYTCECGDIYVADYTEAKGHSYSAMTTQPTCTQNGLVTTFCSSCGDTHTETLEPTGHSFAEGSSKCENCDFDKADDCSCNCHKGGISGLIFKIILFFQRIFKTNKTCACGIAHY
ncbi:MAG: DUF6273 domain-containing protein [Oscillospiraceae bacterium]|nr:DUF6273 domain-containing protein [Oscillospiraceae bacterium]